MATSLKDSSLGAVWQIRESCEGRDRAKMYEILTYEQAKAERNVRQLREGKVAGDIEHWEGVVWLLRFEVESVSSTGLLSSLTPKYYSASKGKGAFKDGRGSSAPSTAGSARQAIHDLMQGQGRKYGQLAEAESRNDDHEYWMQRKKREDQSQEGDWMKSTKGQAERRPKGY